MDKKKIAILITGEIRTNSLGKGNNSSFVENFNQHVLNEKMLKEYDINIFFVTDRIIKEKAYNYFGENLKGLMQLSIEDIDEPLNLNEIENKYMEYYNYRKSNPEKFPIIAAPRPSYIYMFYKLYAAYKLMIDFENQQKIKHEYLLRLRPDTFPNSNLYDKIKLLEDNNLEMLFQHDHAFLGRYNIMSFICNLVLIYGKYNYGEIIHDTKYTRQIMTQEYDYLELAQKCWTCWSESPEVQLFEHVLNYCYLNDISYDKLSPELNFTAIFNDRNESVIWDTKI